MERNIYLKTVTLEEAHALFAEKVADFLKTETIAIDEAYGRVTAVPIFARLSNPNFNAAAMDGIAVKASDTLQADERRPVTLTKDKDFRLVDTGDVIEPPFDSVIMIEDVVQLDDMTVEIRAASHPWQHVRMVGEDFVIGEMILTRDHKITGADLGALAAGGVYEVEVYQQVRVGLIPTGDEIVEPDKVEKAGDIPESNTRMFAGMVLEMGGLPTRYDIVPDQKDAIKAALLKAVEENDLVVINAGSSAGSEDYTSTCIKELGELWVHGIDIRPGKPAILGAIGGKPVIGIPGYPVSAYMTLKHFVLPLLSPQKDQEQLVATLTQAIPSDLRYKEFVRMQLGMVHGKIVASPLKRGAASTMSLVKANGILTIPKESEGYRAGEMVAIEKVKDSSSLSSTLVSIGSHDIIMDILRDLLIKKKCQTHLISSHVGSQGGILAMKRGEAHFAPVHLLNEADGTYNVAEVKKYFPDEKMVLIKCIQRVQGFYQRKGEAPVNKMEDLVTRGLTFVNRQKGAGTRVLTDYMLKQEGISKEAILGYDKELMTHTAVAQAVLAHNADVGMGIESVANEMGLAYTPVGVEDYDFLIREEDLSMAVVQDFITMLKDPEFIAMLEKIGGYKVREPELVYVP